MAAMTWLTSTSPLLAPTFRLTRLASGRDAVEATGVGVAGRCPGGVPSGDDAGQVGSVTEAVDVSGGGVLAVERQVRSVHHVAGVQAADLRHSCVDQSDADALAGVAGPVGVERAHDAGDVVERALVGLGVVAQSDVHVCMCHAHARAEEHGRRGQHGRHAATACSVPVRCH
jgi:hypothetical protein